MRAYPANAKNSRPADWKTPRTPVGNQGSRWSTLASPPATVATTTTASTESSIVTRTRLSTAVLVIPR